MDSYRDCHFEVVNITQINPSTAQETGSTFRYLVGIKKTNNNDSSIDLDYKLKKDAEEVCFFTSHF